MLEKTWSYTQNSILESNSRCSLRSVQGLSGVRRCRCLHHAAEPDHQASHEERGGDQVEDLTGTVHDVLRGWKWSNLIRIFRLKLGHSTYKENRLFFSYIERTRRFPTSRGYSDPADSPHYPAVNWALSNCFAKVQLLDLYNYYYSTKSRLCQELNADFRLILATK